MKRTRNRYLARQLRAALRHSRWDVGTIAFRAYVSRETMARALVGDTTMTLTAYERVAEQLEVSLTFIPWRTADDLPSSGHYVETVVDRARSRLNGGSDDAVAGILKPPTGVGQISIDDMHP